MRNFLSLKSGRAPYNRGGVHFPSRRTALIVEASLLSVMSLALLEGDPEISITRVQVPDDAEGDPYALAAKLAGVTAFSPFRPNIDPATAEFAEGRKIDPTIEAAKAAERAAGHQPPPNTVVVTDAEKDAAAQAEAEAAEAHAQAEVEALAAMEEANAAAAEAEAKAKAKIDKKA